MYKAILAISLGLLASYAMATKATVETGSQLIEDRLEAIEVVEQLAR